MSEQLRIVVYAEHCVMAGHLAAEEPECVDGEWIVLDDNGERRDDRDVVVGTREELHGMADAYDNRRGAYWWRLSDSIRTVLGEREL